MTQHNTIRFVLGGRALDRQTQPNAFSSQQTTGLPCSAAALCSGHPHEKLSLHCCAMVCSSSTAWPQAALISFQSTGCSGVLPNRKPLMVPKGPSCHIRKVSFSTLVDCTAAAAGRAAVEGVRCTPSMG